MFGIAMEILIQAGIALAKILIVVTVMLLTVSYLVYFERKISAWIQNRRGPNRVGPYGALQPFADVFKLLLKEDIVPANANKYIHSLAPFITLFVSFATYAVIPFGPDIQLFGRTIQLALADVNIGVLYVLALTSLGVYGLTFAGWSSGSKYSLLGGIRSSAQMISYEVSMGFSIAGVIMLAESLRPAAIVASQYGFMWNALVQPIGFITFFVSAFAETNRLPFDLPEAEPELVGGYHTEYSSMKFAGFFLAEYANMIIASAMIVTLYLGGWQFPYIDKFGLSAWLTVGIQILSFLLKMALILFFFIWVRWSIPRFRYDQLMNLGWKVMFPLSLLNLLWVAALIMIFKI
ncbi:MAG: NADH-quinone oxidoreductase subunit NuoH [Bacteroidota bacterium]